MARLDNMTLGQLGDLLAASDVRILHHGLYRGSWSTDVEDTRCPDQCVYPEHVGRSWSGKYTGGSKTHSGTGRTFGEALDNALRSLFAAGDRSTMYEMMLKEMGL
jgi:hypothetical protein